MKEINRQLDRLLKAAAGAPSAGVEAPSFKLEAQVMAGWRSLKSRDDSAALIAWFRWAVACACLVMTLSLAWNLKDQSSSTASTGAEEATLADSAMRMALNNE